MLEMLFLSLTAALALFIIERREAGTPAPRQPASMFGPIKGLVPVAALWGIAVIVRGCGRGYGDSDFAFFVSTVIFFVLSPLVILILLTIPGKLAAWALFFVLRARFPAFEGRDYVKVSRRALRPYTAALFVACVLAASIIVALIYAAINDLIFTYSDEGPPPFGTIWRAVLLPFTLGAEYEAVSGGIPAAVAYVILLIVTLTNLVAGRRWLRAKMFAQAVDLLKPASPT